jgi:methylphosphotriester-DNA--protein-cysteine methyltransferase
MRDEPFVFIIFLVFLHSGEKLKMMKLPETQTMYDALLRRDTTFEGIFYVGVKTTRIFCRPACPARKPKPENVEYFGTPSDALYAGYRPCARCQPLNEHQAMPILVKQLCDLVETSPMNKVRGADTVLPSECPYAGVIRSAFSPIYQDMTNAKQY